MKKNSYERSLEDSKSSFWNGQEELGELHKTEPFLIFSKKILCANWYSQNLFHLVILLTRKTLSLNINTRANRMSTDTIPIKDCKRYDQFKRLPKLKPSRSQYWGRGAGGKGNQYLGLSRRSQAVIVSLLKAKPLEIQHQEHRRSPTNTLQCITLRLPQLAAAYPEHRHLCSTCYQNPISSAGKNVWGRHPFSDGRNLICDQPLQQKQPQRCKTTPGLIFFQNNYFTLSLIQLSGFPKVDCHFQDQDQEDKKVFITGCLMF